MGTEFDDSDMLDDEKFMRNWDNPRREPDMDDYMSYLEEFDDGDRAEYDYEAELRRTLVTPSCMVCHKGLMIIEGEHGSYLDCNSTPECQKKQKALLRCSRCCSAMITKNDGKNLYLQCIRYDDEKEPCPNGEKILFQQCPLCGSAMRERYEVSKHWECVRFPHCQGAIGKPIEIDFNYSTAWLIKGKKTYEIKEALDYFDKALQLDHKNIEAKHCKAELLIKVGHLFKGINDHQKAMNAFSEAIEADPKNDIAWYNKAIEEELLGLKLDAFISFCRFVVLTSKNMTSVEYANSRITELGKNITNGSKVQQYIFANTNTTTYNNEESGLIFVAGGTFTMGSLMGVGFQNEHPQHNVVLSDFFISKTPIEWKIWEEVVLWGRKCGYIDLPMRDHDLTNIKSYYTGYGRKGADVDSTHPVTEVSWYDMVKWCNARSQKEGLRPVYYTSKNFIPENLYKTGKIDLDISMVNWSANGYRLPTEAEWEYVAKGGNKSKGFKFSGSDNIDDVAWYLNNSDKKTHSIGTKQPNELGIYDMSGNVKEWCWDRYDEIFYDKSPIQNPKGANKGNYRVLRGGYFCVSQEGCRIALRDYGYSSDQCVSFIGFRVSRITD